MEGDPHSRLGPEVDREGLYNGAGVKRRREVAVANLLGVVREGFIAGHAGHGGRGGGEVLRDGGVDARSAAGRVSVEAVLETRGDL